MSEKTLFEKIAAKEIPSKTIWESNEHIAFLDINPQTRGHTLVVPKVNPGDYLFEMPDNKYVSLMQAAQTVAKLLKAKLDCKRVLLWVEGYEVPHVHIHLIPSYGDGFKEILASNKTEMNINEVYKNLTD